MKRSGWFRPAILAGVLAVAFVGCGDDDDDGSVTGASGRLTVTISATPTAGSAPLDVAFTASVSGGDGPYTYAWSFGDGSSSSLPSPTARYLTGGEFDATLRVTSPDGTGTSNPVRIQVSSGMRVVCHVDPQQDVAPAKVGFRADVVGGSGPYAYAWSFGDGGTASTREGKHVYLSGGTYTPRVTVTSGAASATCANRVEVFDSLIGLCKATPTTGTAPLSVKFVAKVNLCYASGCWWDWSFGDGGRQLGDDAYATTHVYERAGTYTAKATVSSGNVRDVCSHTIRVN